MFVGVLSRFAMDELTKYETDQLRKEVIQVGNYGDNEYKFGDPRCRNADYWKREETSFCQGEARKEANSLMERLLGRGYHISYLELVAQSCSDEIERMKGELRRRNSK